MSRRGELTPGQRGLLDRLSASELAASFYLTGGTALSAFHLHHPTTLDEGRSFFRDVVRTMIRVDDDVIEPVKPRPPEAT